MPTFRVWSPSLVCQSYAYLSVSMVDFIVIIRYTKPRRKAMLSQLKTPNERPAAIDDYSVTPLTPPLHRNTNRSLSIPNLHLLLYQCL